MRIIISLIILLTVAGCGLLVPGTPGHEPNYAGNVNGVTGERAGTR